MRAFWVKLLLSFVLVVGAVRFIPALGVADGRPVLACGTSAITMTANGQPAMFAPLTPQTPANAPIGIFDQQYPMNQPIHFTEDLSGLGIPLNPNLYRWEWDFGDGGKGVGFTVTHMYTKVGHYAVRLGVVDLKNPTGPNSNSEPNLDSTALTIIDQSYPQAPIAKITTTGTSSVGTYVQLESTLTFDAAGSASQVGGGITYSWNFDDQNSDTNVATGERVTHKFESPGKGYVELTVQDARGARTIITIPINVEAELPMAQITASVTHASIGADITFDASGSAPTTAIGDAITKYHWVFGDGSQQTTTGPTITHRFAKASDYSVRVEAFNKDNLPGLAYTTVYITDPGLLGLGSHAGVIIGGFGAIIVLLALALVGNAVRERREYRRRLALAAARRAARGRPPQHR